MIHVFGSINVDLTFRLAHLPVVGETVLTPSFTQAVGGKGANQAIAAARDGAATRFIGCLGSDGFGAMARQMLHDMGLDVTSLATVPGATGLAAVWIDGEGRNAIAVASGANGALRADALRADAIKPGSLVVLQMEVPIAATAAAIALAKSAGAKVLLNLAPALPLPLAALSQVDILVLNEHEADSLCQALALATATPEEQGHALADKLGAVVIITLGAAGAVGIQNGSLWRAAALPVTAIDTTGAGDCFVGVLAAGLMRGLEFPGAMRRAAVAGSLACTVVGAMPSFPSRARIDAALAASIAHDAGPT
jgi:ribokinase